MVNWNAVIYTSVFWLKCIILMPVGHDCMGHFSQLSSHYDVWRENFGGTKLFSAITNLNFTVKIDVSAF